MPACDPQPSGSVYAKANPRCARPWGELAPAARPPRRACRCLQQWLTVWLTIDQTRPSLPGFADVPVRHRCGAAPRPWAARALSGRRLLLARTLLRGLIGCRLGSFRLGFALGLGWRFGSPAALLF